MKHLTIIILMTNICFGQSVIENRYFSPNEDKKKDTIKIPLKITQKSTIKKWIVYFVKKEKSFKIIRKYQSKTIKILKPTNFETIWKSLIAPKKKLEIPPYIEWDGKTTDGKIVGEGTYYFQIQLINKNNDKIVSPLIPIIVDTTAPDIKLQTKNKAFSPNNDGIEDTFSFIILASKKAQKTDSIKLNLINKGNQTIKTLHFKVNELKNKPLRINWLGKDKHYKQAPQGRYTLVLKASDYAGNVFLKQINDIILTK